MLDRNVNKKISIISIREVLQNKPKLLNKFNKSDKKFIVNEMNDWIWDTEYEGDFSKMPLPELIDSIKNQIDFANELTKT